MNQLEIIGTVAAIALSIILFGALAVGLVAVIVGTITKNRFGLNFRPVKCPECGAPAPVVRAPKNWNQSLFGGCTCAECGCEYDKWGRPVES